MSEPVLRILRYAGSSLLNSSFDDLAGELNAQIIMKDDLPAIIEENCRSIYHLIVLDFLHTELLPDTIVPIINSRIYRPPILYLLRSSDCIKHFPVNGYDNFCVAQSIEAMPLYLLGLLLRNDLFAKRRDEFVRICTRLRPPQTMDSIDTAN